MVVWNSFCWEPLLLFWFSSLSLPLAAGMATHEKQIVTLLPPDSGMATSWNGRQPLLVAKDIPSL